MVLIHVAIGLLFAFALWGYAFAAGSLTLLAFDRASHELDLPAGSNDRSLDLLIASALGLAELMLVLFALGSMHLFVAPAIVAAAIVFIVAIAALSLRTRGAAVVASQFRSSLACARRPFWLATLVLCAVLSAPAILPPTMWDSTMYHFAHAIDWANSGSLTVDPFVRFPLAAFGVETLFGMTFALHLTAYVEFVSWTFFAISATGVSALAAKLLEDAGAARKIASVGGFVTSVAFIACPFVERYADTGYIDIASGTLLLAFGAAAVRCLARFEPYAVATAILGGAFVASKITLVPSAFLALVLLAYFAKRHGVPRRELLVPVALLVLFACPWFLKNALTAGDPFDPILNLAIRHHDPFWTQADLSGQKANLHRGLFVPFLPFIALTDPGAVADFVSLNFCFMYLPIVGALCVLTNRSLRTSEPVLATLLAIVAFTSAQELLATDWVVRYSLHFFALFLALLMLAAWKTARWLAKSIAGRDARSFQVASIALIGVLAIPATPSPGTYGDIVSAYGALAQGVADPTAYLSSTQGYRDEERLSAVVRATGSASTVLAVHFENLAYYFRANRVISIGDWFGPGRVADLRDAIARDTLATYLRHFNVAAVMFATHDGAFDTTEDSELRDELGNAGFEDTTIPGSPVNEFVRGDALRLARASGLAIAITGASVANVPRVATSTLKPLITPAHVTASAHVASSGSMLSLRAASSAGVSFVATPSLVPASIAGAMPAVQLRWSVPNASKIEIHMAAPDGQLFTQSSGDGSATTGPWVAAGAHFYLQDVSNGNPGVTVSIMTAQATKAGS